MSDTETSPAAPETPDQPQQLVVETSIGSSPEPEAPKFRKVAVVLMAARKVVVGQETFTAHPGQVIRIEHIAPDQHWNPGDDTKVIDAGELQVGDLVEDGGHG